ncbi:ESX-1 secretion-associated protein [Mycolicibacterium llatzerense]|uniref:ESX-1 secretion-associated protein n=1 Tax=Mycolicibacterium llatzerense TaxID=280871 RepID=UPI0008DDDBFB|nr:ESX-1 secretion-associated protein [Mycolicibacterium llatzerense]
MSGELKVTPTDLTELAGKHREAAEHLGTAGAATEGATGSVVLTHGLVCSLTSAALGSAQSSRDVAVREMQATSNSLAGRLDTAASKYAATDAHEGAALDQQMPPR